MLASYGDRVRRDVGRRVKPRGHRIGDDLGAFARSDLKKIMPEKFDCGVGLGGVGAAQPAAVGDIELAAGRLNISGPYPREKKQQRGSSFHRTL
jgi:hypothetical protein